MPDGGVIYRQSCQQAGIDIIQGTGQTLPPFRIFDSLGNLISTSSVLTLPVSSPGTGLQTEVFGAGATAGAATQATVIGNGASVNGNASTAIGFGALAGTSSTAIGELSGDLVANSVWIGFHSGATGIPGCICIGANTNDNNASGQFVAGSDFAPITDIFWGKGVITGNPTGAGITIHGTDGSGANILGSPVTIAGGRSTGNVKGGDVIIQTSPAGGAGSTQNSLVTIFQLTGDSKIGVFGVTPVVQQANASQATISLITDANAKAVCQSFYNLLKNYGWAPATA